MRSRSERIFLKLCSSVNYTIRKIAQLTGISKSAVNRHKRAIERRNLFPESCFWETKEGGAWLCRLYVAVLFLFGITCGIGAGRISLFIKLLRLDMHIGSSPSTIKNNINKIQDLLEEYRESQQTQLSNNKSLTIVGGADETFIEDMGILHFSVYTFHLFGRKS